MPVLDTIRKSLLGGRGRVRTGRCLDCGADFSMPAGEPIETCPYCGSSDLKLRA